MLPPKGLTDAILATDRLFDIREHFCSVGAVFTLAIKHESAGDRGPESELRGKGNRPRNLKF